MQTFFKSLENRVYGILTALIATLTLLFIALFSLHFDWKKQLAIVLLIWLPSTLTLAYGLSVSRHFHYIFFIALGVYVTFAGILISALTIAKERSSENSVDTDALSC